MLTEFGKCIRKIRIEHGAILADMAKSLDVTPSYLSAVEHGKRKIPNTWIESIAKAYDLTRDEIIDLQNAAERSRNEIVIPLGNSRERDDVALTFARVFDNCDQETLSNLQSYLGKIREEKKN